MGQGNPLGDAALQDVGEEAPLLELERVEEPVVRLAEVQQVQGVEVVELFPALGVGQEEGRGVRVLDHLFGDGVEVGKLGPPVQREGLVDGPEGGFRVQFHQHE